jgi:hypothetical protein
MKNIIIISLVVFFTTSCVSTKSTIKNIDDTIASPTVNPNLECFIFTKISQNKKYGYDEDYPINVGFSTPEEGLKNQTLFLNALAGPKGEKIKYTKKESCCPYPTKKEAMGVGLIDKYEIVWDGIKKPIILYLNKYERGELLIPVGFTARK